MKHFRGSGTTATGSSKKVSVQPSSSSSLKVRNKGINKKKRHNFKIEKENKKRSLIKRNGGVTKKEREGEEKKMEDQFYGKKMKNTIKRVIDFKFDEDKIFMTKKEANFFAGATSSLPNFLEQSNLDIKKKNKNKRKSENDEEDQQPEDSESEGSIIDENENESEEDDNDDIDNLSKYEGKVRVASWENKEESQKLPIKSNGKIVQVRENILNKPILKKKAESDSEEDNEISDMGSDNDISDNEVNEEVSEKTQIMQELENDPEIQLINRKEKIIETKKRIVILIESILENPEKNISNLEEFLNYCFDEDSVICQLALVSGVELFKDIIPSYHIRLPSEQELKNKASFETNALRKFESELLRNYSRFVKLLFSYIPYLKDKISLALNANALSETQAAALKKRLKKKRRLFQAQGMSMEEASKASEREMDSNSFKSAQIAIVCLSRLLSNLSHFNYTKDILTHIVPLINHKFENVSMPIYQAVMKVFESDKTGNVTLEVMRILARLVKEKPSEASILMMKLFLKLKLSFAVIFAAAKKEAKAPKKVDRDIKKFVRRRQKEAKIAEKELQKDMAEGETEVELKVKQKIQIELLNLVFTTYFRVLKNPNQTANLLPFVLQGLSRYAHLINVELVVDLLQVLKELMLNRSLGFDSSLHCVIAAFETLQGPGQALDIEVKEYYIFLYNILWRVVEVVNQQHISLLLQVLQLAFVKRRVLSVELVASFVQRLSTISLQLLPHDSIGLLSTLRLLLDKYPRSQQLLENEPTPTGIFLMDSKDPERSHAFATSAWELSLLRASYHPFLQKMATMVLTGAELPTAVTRVSPVALLDSYSTKLGGFNPPVQAPPKYGDTMIGQMHSALKKKGDSDFVLNLKYASENISCSEELICNLTQEIHKNRVQVKKNELIQLKESIRLYERHLKN